MDKPLSRGSIQLLHGPRPSPCFSRIRFLSFSEPHKPVGLNASYIWSLASQSQSFSTRASMECNASVGGLNRVHLMEKTASAGISRVRFGVRPKQSALRTGTTIRSFHSQYSPHSSSSSSFYDVLCVSPNVSTSDIKSAYRQMALKYHPDVCPTSEKEECSRLFLQVQEAYETLSDPFLRQNYDWRLQNGMAINEHGGRLESCNHAWEAQLMELIKRSDHNSSSWGSRMRRQNQQATAC